MPDTMIQVAPAPSTPAPGHPPVIAAAIGDVMGKVKSLSKGEWNGHGGYNFASIDDFLAAVGPLCVEAGLIILQDEADVAVIDRGSKAWAKITYAFTLMHTSGVISPRPIHRTVFQTITGPQTTGSSQSYALKMFMRSLFLIPTGDRDDADYHKQQDMAAAQAPQRVAQHAPAPRLNHQPRKIEQAIQRASSGPQRIPIPEDENGPRIREWLHLAAAALDGRAESWRREWLELNQAEIEELRGIRAEWADRVEAAAIAPDLKTDRGES